MCGCQPVQCTVGTDTCIGALGLVHEVFRCMGGLQALGKDKSGMQACARGG